MGLRDGRRGATVIIKLADRFKIRKNNIINLILLFLNRNRKRKGSQCFVQLVLVKTQGTVMRIYTILMMLGTVIWRSKSQYHQYGTKPNSNMLLQLNAQSHRYTWIRCGGIKATILEDPQKKATSRLLQITFWLFLCTHRQLHQPPARFKINLSSSP